MSASAHRAAMAASTWSADWPGDVRVVLEVHARDLLLSLRHDAQFPRRPAVVVGHEIARIHATCFQQQPQTFRRLVDANHADERYGRPKRREVHRDVGRAARAIVVVVVLDDRHRGFGREPLDAAEEEVIEHHVADDDDATTRKPADDLRRAGLAETHRCRGTDSGRSAANGSVSTTSRSIRNSESPKLYSKRPAPSIAVNDASAPAASARVTPVRCCTRR